MRVLGELQESNQEDFLKSKEHYLPLRITLPIGTDEES